MNYPFGGPGQFFPGQFMPSYMQQPQPMQTPQPTNGFTGIQVVDGVSSVNSGFVPTGGRMMYVSGTEDVFWIKTVDMMGNAQIQEFEFKPVEKPINNEPSGDYVSAEQFAKLQREFAELKEKYELNIRKSEPEEVTATAEPITEDSDW